MKISIIGTGGVGGYFGGKMARAGFEVSFLARGKHLEAINQNGLIVKSILGDFTVENVHASDTIANLGESDIIIVAVKAWQVKEVAGGINSILKPDTVIIPLQNGVLAADELSNWIDKKHILGGLCRILSMIEAPGVIKHFGIEPVVLFGEFDKHQSERTLRVKKVFDKSGISSKIANDIEAEIWKKFINICVSGLLAITRTSYGELREIKETRQMMIDLFKEIYLLSQKKGIQIKPDFVEKTVAFVDTFPYNSTSSLTRDVWEGKPSEIEYQNGTVVKMAKEYGLEVPVNTFVYHSILPAELKARERK
ncbi:MAG: 2-dehydropantoate 2-reductase [Bacteroidales bacterium]|nr:2-dehydropantoate 2-reductase [Bacteroidales bacterium]MBN2819585.1 2-dehydropantoate 2-reductase [Bacteroidales bacterium]